MFSRALNLGVFGDRDSNKKPGGDDQNKPYDFLCVPPREKHTATVIWLHGLGGSGRDLLPYAEDVGEGKGLEHVKFILPQARNMPVTGTGGYIIPSWFDCFSFDIGNRDEDEEGQRRAATLINDMIDREVDCGIPSSRVIVGGLSQGSAVALYVAVTTQRPLGGVFVLSGYVPQRRKIAELASPISKTLPYFWGHGQKDRQVNYELSLKSAESLAGDLRIEFVEVEGRSDNTEGRDPSAEEQVTSEEDGAKDNTFKFVGYPDLIHWMSSEEMDDLGRWIMEVVPGSWGGASTTTET